MSFVSIMMNSYTDWSAIPPANCASVISSWVSSHGEKSPILCDTDKNGNGLADAAEQWDQGCGTPTNFYIDQGHVQYKYVCGAEISSTAIENAISPEVNPETCE